ncbi:AAA family ATPase [Mesorhizobium sp. RP14(2022)]|uniref:AAA family ATPase n=1 Tax=Mesorhizobium liriopis TaxID=2953882 RepID=A0ABT1C4B6_9HYPH|nr:AAA family ATPase [Mesorhizobium liriopis]MCO6049358.1 AAA family ATPase [Mesorhizobium liriopis]
MFKPDTDITRLSIADEVELYHFHPKGRKRDRKFSALPGHISLQTFTAGELLARKFEPIKYVVPGYVAEGLTILAGPPKLGKSWFALHMAAAVTSGFSFLNRIAEPRVEALYLALEDNERRLQSRINKLYEGKAAGTQPALTGLHFAIDWPRADNGGITKLKEWIECHPKVGLVIVDVLAMFKGLGGNRRQTQYDAEYLAVKELQTLALEAKVAIVVIHHTRKMRSEGSPYEEISGTYGLQGAADSCLILRRESGGVVLRGHGRDIEEIETAVRFNEVTCTWEVIGSANEVGLSSERQRILEVLKTAGEPLRPNEILQRAGMSSEASLNVMLHRMYRVGELVRASRGVYGLPGRVYEASKIGKKVTR